ncbi:MAG TPA: long-chain fatty acid--CoA ligase, partial [Pasteurellaceae bacterium]|nr:long-chain fatty acid--CoA ligase [Pasteurellaceae bacterium]
MRSDLHFINSIRQQAKTLKKLTALRYKKEDKWWDISWEDFQLSVDQLSLALLASNIDVQDKIGIFAHNMPNWTIADIAVLQIRAVTVPIYAANTAAQAKFIINNADIKIVFAGDQEQYDQMLEIVEQCPQLEKIIAMKENIELHAHPIAAHWDDFVATGSVRQQE